MRLTTDLLGIPTADREAAVVGVTSYDVEAVITELEHDAFRMLMVGDHIQHPYRRKFSGPIETTGA